MFVYLEFLGLLLNDFSALGCAGKSVLHLDENEFYGGRDGSLTLDQLRNMAKQGSLRT